MSTYHGKQLEALYEFAVAKAVDTFRGEDLIANADGHTLIAKMGEPDPWFCQGWDQGEQGWAVSHPDGRRAIWSNGLFNGYHVKQICYACSNMGIPCQMGEDTEAAMARVAPIVEEWLGTNEEEHEKP